MLLFIFARQKNRDAANEIPHTNNFLAKMNRFLSILACLVCLLTACNDDIDKVNERVDSLEATVSDLKSTLQSLQQAYADGKVITSVSATSDGNGGYVITFSDNSSINIQNGANGKDGKDGEDGDKGADGVTPFLKVDQQGYLTVSYDNGQTFSRVQDNDGKDITVASSSVSVTTNDDGYYVFSLYNTSDPENVLSEIVTPFSSDPSTVINSIVEDEKASLITITMADGSSFTFGKLRVVVTGIALLTTEAVYISDSAAITFRINPQNALFNYDVNSDSCDIALDRIGATNKVVAPDEYSLVKVEQCLDEEGNVIPGQYRAIIKDAGTSVLYDDQLALVVSTTDLNGEPTRVSSSAFRLVYTNNSITAFSFTNAKNGANVLKDVVATIEGNNITISSPYITKASALIANFDCIGNVYVGDQHQVSGSSVVDFSDDVVYKVVGADGKENLYTVDVKYSGLPIMEIVTPDSVAITSKEDWTKGVSYKIIKTDGSVDCEGTMQMKGRGNTTWSYPKKPYAIKLDSKEKVLGLAKEKRFDLLANWMDRTLLRNDVSYKIANLTSTMGWNPRGEFVEVVLNGKHIGNYYLCEHIKIGSNRVDINEMEATATEGEAITGGYIMELDTYYDETYKFKSAIKQLPYMFKDPDEVNDAQFNYMKNYVDTLESSLYDETKFAARKFADYMDLDSYVDWWLVYELAGNDEPNHPKSCYCHKDINGKMIAGPVWDFDWGSFVYGGAWKAKGSLYYPQLFKDAEFVKIVKSKWAAQKSLYEDVADYIESQGEYLSHSDEMNIALWPITSTANGDESMSYAEAVNRMLTRYKARIEWLDSKINSL